MFKIHVNEIMNQFNDMMLVNDVSYLRIWKWIIQGPVLQMSMANSSHWCGLKVEKKNHIYSQEQWKETIDQMQ